MGLAEDVVAPVLVPAEGVEALEYAELALPSTLRMHWRRGASSGWAVQVLFWRQPLREADGSIRPATRKVALTDPDTGVRLLTARGAPRSTSEPIPGTRVLSETWCLQGAIAWEGLRQRLVALWTDGKFDLALHRQPYLGRLSSTELRAFMESGGMPPARQRGIPLTLWQERALKATRNEEESDD